MKKLISLVVMELAITWFLSLALQAQTVAEVINRGDTVLALKLIKGGASPNLPDANGTTPLMTACRSGNMPIVNFLLDNGATADQPRSPKGRTALMITCAYYGGITITKLLIAHGADVNATANDGTTALMLAAKNAKLDVVEYLLAKGANALKKDATGSTALDYAQKADPAVFGSAGYKDCQLNKAAVIARLIPISH